MSLIKNRIDDEKILVGGGSTTLHTHGHNDTADKQGGAVDDYQHMTTAQVAKVDFISVTQAVDLDDIESQVLNLDGSSRTFLNKILTDLSNTVHADAVHFGARATEDILKGQPVITTGFNTNDLVYEVALADNLTGVATGIAGKDILTDGDGEMIVNGTLVDVDTNQWTEGAILYVNGAGTLTETEPTTGYSQPIAYVLKSAGGSGALQIAVNYPKQDSADVRFYADGDIAAINVQDAIVEVRDDTDTKLSFKLDKAGGTISSDLTVSGNFTVNGTTTTVNTEVTTTDNLIILNDGEVGTGVTSGEAGIQIDRGLATDYEFKFDEVDDSFKIGEIGSLQKVATREDAPIDTGIAIWDDATSKFNTVIDTPFNNTGTNLVATTSNAATIESYENDKYLRQRVVITPDTDADYVLTDVENKYGYLEVVTGAWTTSRNLVFGGEPRVTLIDGTGCSYAIGVKGDTSFIIVSAVGGGYTMYFDGLNVTSDPTSFTKWEIVDANDALDGRLDLLENLDIVDRADKKLEVLDSTLLGYGDGVTIHGEVTGDTAQPDGKLAKVEYGAGANDGIEYMVYNVDGKLIRADHYLDRATYLVDGTGRNGYTSLNYTNGKLSSSSYTDVSETQKGAN